MGVMKLTDNIPNKGSVADLPDDFFSPPPPTGNVSELPSGFFSSPIKQGPETLFIPKTGDLAALPSGGLARISEIASRGFSKGQLNTELSELHYGQLLGDDSLAVSERIKSIKSNIGGEIKTEGVLEDMLRASAEGIPQFWEIMKGGGVGGVTGGLVGAGGALIVGQLPFSIGLPEEMVTVPAAIRAGTKFGGGAGAANASFEANAGSLYGEMLGVTNEEGETLPPMIAKIGSFMGGGLMAGLDMIPVKFLTTMIPGSEVLFNKIGAKITDNIKLPFDINIASKTGKDAFVKFLFNLAKGTALEVPTEAAQEGVNIATVELSKYLSDGEFESITGQAIYDRISASAKEALLATPGITSPFAGARLASDLNAVRKQRKENKKKIEGEFTPEVQEAVDIANDKKDQIAKEGGTKEQLIQVNEDLDQDLEIIEQSAELDNASFDAEDTQAQLSQDTKSINKAFEDSKFMLEEIVTDKVSEAKEGIDLQEGKGFARVPKRPETLSEFLKSKGGLNDKIGEVVRFTRKESPDLNGVAHKKGKLDLDSARELAVESGFLSQDGTVEDLLDALESESFGVDIVSDVDIEALVARDEIIDANEQFDQARDERIAEIGEVRTLKTAINKGARAAMVDVKAVQTNIINALDKTNLDAKDKSKFIRLIKNIQTPAQLRKAMPKIQDRVSGLLETGAKRKLLNKISSTVKKIKKSKNISVDFIKRVKDLVDGVNTKKPTQKTKNKLDAAVDFFKRNPDLPMPPTLLSKLNDMNKRQIEDVSVDELRDILDQIGILSSQGKLKLALQKKAVQRRKESRLRALSNDTIKRTSKDLSKASLGEVLTAKDRFSNLFINGANRAQRFGLNKNPMDVIFDVFDGSKDYKGANSTIFKRTIDSAHSRFLQLKESVTRDVKAIADKNKFDRGNYNRIGAFAILQQDGGRERLLATGITTKELDALTLNKSEKEMYNAMREKLDSLKPALKDVMRTVYNKDFEDVDDYFPFMTDFESMTETEIQNMFGEDVLLITDTEVQAKKKNVERGFTKSRTGGKHAVKIDALDVFLNHVDNATYLIEMGQDIKELGDLAGSNEFADISGDVNQTIVRDWMDLLARKGKVRGGNEFLDAFRINTGSAILGFKLSSVLIQPTALADGAAMVGGSYVSRGIKNVTDSKWRQFMVENMPEIRERVGDDPNYKDLGGDGFIGKSQKAGFWALQKLDLLAASAVASGAYIKYVETNGGVVDFANPDLDAIEFSQLMVRRTQSSAFAKDVAPIISQGKLTGNVSVDKLILQFQSFMLNRWSLIEHDFYRAGIKGGRTTQALNVATWLVLANMAEYQIRHYTKELISSIFGNEVKEDEDETLTDVVAKQMISNIPFVSSLVSSAEYGSVPVPAVSMVESIAESASFAIKSKSTGKKVKHSVNAAILAAGVLTGVPFALQGKQLLNEATKKPKRKKRGENKSVEGFNL